eukprot:CAMPEP_0198283476 /NCGR_PEP_ID=MMETSP1449-20131203/3045_1 /TAXON_ID=420275 /ORGANISM="Attheya septentrionalis, Strain CCMP2084" /LENGTH=418 /DNA_ID=CAMNT_0043980079 /DNA_START=58 /DNA_END=1314 /DNA_ORIENTATION=+
MFGGLTKIITKKVRHEYTDVLCGNNVTGGTQDESKQQTQQRTTANGTKVTSFDESMELPLNPAIMKSFDSAGDGELSPRPSSPIKKGFTKGLRSGTKTKVGSFFEEVILEKITPPPPKKIAPLPPPPPFGVEVDLTTLEGVVLHQRPVKRFVAQHLGVPWEIENQFAIKAMPKGAMVAANNKSSAKWQPTLEEVEALPDLFVIKENSNNWTRMRYTCSCLRDIRPMDMLLFQNSEEKMIINKPARCGGFLGCPLESTLRDATGAKVGFVQENFSPYPKKCFQFACCCSFYHNVYAPVATTAPGANAMNRNGVEADPKFELKVHKCCFQGTSNNCLGGTCLKHHATFEIRDPKTGEVVSNIQKVYAPEKMNHSCCDISKIFGGPDIFAIGFPEKSTQKDRLLLITAVLQMEVALFEEDH